MSHTRVQNFLSSLYFLKKSFTCTVLNGIFSIVNIYCFEWCSILINKMLCIFLNVSHTIYFVLKSFLAATDLFDQQKETKLSPNATSTPFFSSSSRNGCC